MPGATVSLVWACVADARLHGLRREWQHNLANIPFGIYVLSATLWASVQRSRVSGCTDGGDRGRPATRSAA